MRIGILTQSLRNNYGGLLQNYALQTVLRQNGHEVCTLDWEWINRNPIKTYIVETLRLRNKGAKKRYKPSPEEDAIIHQHVNHFRDTYIVHTDKFKNHEDFVRYDKQVTPNAYIVGSDQCWRPKYNPFQDEMFLNFVERQNVRRIAYAASFGTDSWDFENGKYARMAKAFDLVTVREQSGTALCKEHLGVKAYHVLDPTMLLDIDDYLKLTQAEKEMHSNGELFYYILDSAPEITNAINQVGIKLNMKPFTALPKYKEEYRTKENVKENINDCVYPSPAKWLKGILDSKLAIVDSFHGMAFCIIFNKPFWAIGNENRGMSRFTSLLEMFGLRHRLVELNELSKIDLEQPIEWTAVNVIREQKKRESLELLLNALSK